MTFESVVDDLSRTVDGEFDPDFNLSDDIDDLNDFDMIEVDPLFSLTDPLGY